MSSRTVYPTVVAYVRDDDVTLQVQQAYGDNGAVKGTALIRRLRLDDPGLGQALLDGVAESERVSAREITDDESRAGQDALLAALGAADADEVVSGPYDDVALSSDPRSAELTVMTTLRNRKGEPQNGAEESRPMPVGADEAHELFWTYLQKARDARAQNYRY